jgi:peptidyl-prolyl cis-trans isomerase D
VVSLTKVQDGAMSEDDKKRIDMAKKNIAKAIGDSEFNALINTLETKADIKIHRSTTPAQ